MYTLLSPISFKTQNKLSVYLHVSVSFQVFALEISKQLQAYEVEYHVLREEMLFSPTRGETDMYQKIEDANRNLKQQNMELLEKIQHIHSHHRSLEITIHNLQTNESKLKSHIKTLELERKALLNAVTKLRSLVPDEEFVKLDISLPPLSPSLSSSPIHHQNSNNSIRGAIKKAVAKSLSSPLSELGSKQFQFEWTCLWFFIYLNQGCNPREWRFIHCMNVYKCCLP